MRLIDADDATKWAREHILDAKERFAIIDFLRDCSTIDAVPVVRCRECKHLNVINQPKLYANCPKTNTVFLPFELDTRTHFCSLGERKEGADNGQ